MINDLTPSAYWIGRNRSTAPAYIDSILSAVAKSKEGDGIQITFTRMLELDYQITSQRLAELGWLFRSSFKEGTAEYKISTHPINYESERLRRSLDTLSFFTGF